MKKIDELEALNILEKEIKSEEDLLKKFQELADSINEALAVKEDETLRQIDSENTKENF